MAAHLLRTCIACRTEARKGELLRIVLAEGKLTFDSAQKLPGRGAYLHPALTCWRKAGEVKRWKNAFGGKKHLPKNEGRFTKGEIERLMEEVRTVITR